MRNHQNLIVKRRFTRKKDDWTYRSSSDYGKHISFVAGFIPLFFPCFFFFCIFHEGGGGLRHSCIVPE